MGKRGPLPKNRDQRKLTGNASNRRLPSPANLAVGVEVLECPTELTTAAKAYWHRVVPLIQKTINLSPLDVPSLAFMCQCWDDFQDCTRIVEKEGRFYETTNGSKAVHPAFKMQQVTYSRFVKFAEMFGLTPKSRERLEANSMTPSGDGGAVRNKMEELLDED